MRVLAQNTLRFLVELDAGAGDAIYDFERDELRLLDPPATRESVLRFDPYWTPNVDPDLAAGVRDRVARLASS